MPEWIKIVLLGIVEGITEFLPVSSTGHLIVAAALLDFGNSSDNTFVIFIQFGAVLAVILYYRDDLVTQLRHVHTDVTIQRLWLSILIALVPAVIVGLLFQDWIKQFLFSPFVVAISLIVGGLLFLLAERTAAVKGLPPPREIETITLKQAFIVGIAQMLAIAPGMSRSGTSIVGGMMAGLNRSAATRFSFYLAIPTLGGATLFELAANLHRIQANDLSSLLLGAAISCIVAWASIGWLLRYVSRNSFVWFGYYRIIAGAVILLLLALGWL